MKKTFKQRTINGRQYQLLTLPGTNLFQFEVVNTLGSNIERAYEEIHNKKVYGISHLIEHLGFRAPKDYSTEELLEAMKVNGTYNASTDHDRINYWYRTVSEKAKTAINLVCNFAFNDLTEIPEDEFEMERKVVSNEARRYADDDQMMFYVNVVPTACGYHPEDNIIGISDTVESFTLEDAIKIKNIFLAANMNTFNITYDDTVFSEEEIVDLVEAELERWPPPIINIHDLNVVNTYHAKLELPEVSTHHVRNESEQAMTALLIDGSYDGHDVFTIRLANSYLSEYSDTSLTDIIREKNGLTYGIYFFDDLISNNTYTQFMCDVTKGTEDLLLQLFSESINQSVDNFTEEVYNKLVDTTKLQRTLSMVNQQKYTSLFWLGIWYPDLVEQLNGQYGEDIDATFDTIQQDYATYDNVKSYLNIIRTKVNNKLYTKVKT